MKAVFELKTDKSVEEAVAAIKEEMNKIKFGILFEMSFKDTLKENGIDFEKEFVILEVCSPAQAEILLEKQIEIGYFLPCKVAVYEKNGSVYIGAPRLTTLIGLTDSKEGLTDTAQELENILRGAIEAAV